MKQHLQCSKATLAEILFHENKNLEPGKITHNAKYKSRLKCLLAHKFKAAGISIKQLENDADILIVETAHMISKTQHNSTFIVGENIHLLIILTARTPLNLGFFLLKPGKGKMGQKI
ncbi:hypothetical protein AVEN_20670-1 [Araneus ventricosus]|uniref:Uncharacterized protein n=1 Tax=Araneus ventricosus TaxID=182803 RepID=A0A4Y2XA05_ARAVE|nr:hypothetical protein AVEN_20670-1 [Araneus ventricosus]